MSYTDLRHGLVESLNELQKLIEATYDPEKILVLNEQYHVLNSQLQAILRNNLAAVFNTKEYLDAVDALNQLVGEAKEATTQINKTAKVIQKTADAIGKIAQVFVILATGGAFA